MHDADPPRARGDHAPGPGGDADTGAARDPANVVVALTGPRRGSPVEALLAQFGARVRQLVVQHCRGNQGLDADDVEQEVRIRLWKAIERDPDARLPASYIQRVVVSTVIDAVRRASARPAEPMPEEAESGDWLGDEGPGPEGRASSRQEVEILRRCLQNITPRRRLPVELHLQGYVPQEIADLMGLTFDSAKKLVERGLKDLKARLRAQGIDADD